MPPTGTLRHLLAPSDPRYAPLGRPVEYRISDIQKIIPRGHWASWRTLVAQARVRFGMSPRTLSRYLKRLRESGSFVLHDHLYHRLD